MTNEFPEVTVVGAGLAGCEAAWQLAKRGVPVKLIDMKPGKFSPAHKSAGFAELVCSNSLKAEQLSNASGLLKAEMRALDGLILRCAEAARVPAGGALAVDRVERDEHKGNHKQGIEYREDLAAHRGFYFVFLHLRPPP